MDLASALDELPEVHATALRLHRAGTDAGGIAAALGIEVEAVAPLLRVAEAKLASLLAAPDPPEQGGSGAVGQSPDAGHEPGNLVHTRH
jgi:DNA-directed RNA polymerase specialized sigma24 family protein